MYPRLLTPGLVDITVGWTRATKAGRLCLIPDRLVPKTWKTVLAACLSSFALGVDGWVQGRSLFSCSRAPPVQHSLWKGPRGPRRKQTVVGAAHPSWHS